MKLISTLFAIILLLGVVFADVYMHNPRGSNNRLDEQSANANNQNRLFNSQNNAAGGYCWGPPMHFYTGSQLGIEWTNQHSCGEENNECQIILQFMCADSIRDGNTTTTIQDDVTTFDVDVTGSPGVKKYGMHEHYSYYQECKGRQRNGGLFIADRGVNNNIGARGTRQNNNGNRHGFECPEERDYYPYWHPTPWIDIAILTTDTSRCPYYRANSFNTNPKGYCNTTQFNNPTACPAGQWYEKKPHNSQTGRGCIGEPDCIAAPWNRDNHLGNGKSGYMNTYNWTIPSCVISENCVLRLRYNISTTDYDGWNTFSSRNGANLSPVKQNPYVDPCTSSSSVCNLTLAMDTSQFGRTFQDRSYIFGIRPRPSGVDASDRIFNLNVRGKRGNIVQAYPAVEYDFTPNRLHVRPGDYIHMQWTGCDNNPQNFAGEGKAGTDRSNIVQMTKPGANKPAFFNSNTLTAANSISSSEKIFSKFSDAYRAAYLDQTNCATFEELKAQGNENQNDRNCMKLNAAPAYVNLGLYKVGFEGRAYYMSSRNNNFSNRSQKGTIVSTPALQVFGVVIVSVGSAAFFCSLIFAGIAAFNHFSAASPFANSPVFNANPN